jgi:hypothetical protein
MKTGSEWGLTNTPNRRGLAQKASKSVLMKAASEPSLRKIASAPGLMAPAGSNPIANARQAQAEAKQSTCPPIASDDGTSDISSVGQGREERDPGLSCSSRAFEVEFADLLHQLANTTTGVLIHAQMLGLKLPPYSHLRRPLREIERNAQRGGELMKSLLRRLMPDATDTTNDHEITRRVADCNPGLKDAVTAQEPDTDSGNAENLPRLRNSGPASGFFAAEPAMLKAELTSRCDRCTSTFPKKG